MTTTPRFTVKDALTPKPRASHVENSEYAKFVRRIIRAYRRRIATGDIEALTGLLDLSKQMENTIAKVVGDLRAFGYSWAEIAQRTGTSRQAAQQRWGGNRIAWHQCPTCNRIWHNDRSGRFNPEDYAHVDDETNMDDFPSEHCPLCIKRVGS